MKLRRIPLVVGVLPVSLLVIVAVLALWHPFSGGPQRETFGMRHDPELLYEIAQWKPGQPPPGRLLIIPSDIETIVAKSAPICPPPLLNDGETLAAVTNKDLLAAVAFDPRASTESVGLAARQFVRLSGAEALSRLVVEKRRRNPSAVSGARVEILEAFLHSPILMLYAVRLSPDKMAPGKAESVLQEMKEDLEAGSSWAETYSKFSELYPANRSGIAASAAQGSLIQLLCMGLVTLNGLSLDSGHVLEALPVQHLEELFRVERGTHILKSATGVYLYHVKGLQERVP